MLSERKKMSFCCSNEKNWNYIYFEKRNHMQVNFLTSVMHDKSCWHITHQSWELLKPVVDDQIKLFDGTETCGHQSLFFHVFVWWERQRLWSLKPTETHTSTFIFLHMLKNKGKRRKDWAFYLRFKIHESCRIGYAWSIRNHSEWKSSRREGFNLQHHRMWQAADKSAQNLHRYSSILVHDYSDRLVRVLFCASSICFNFHYHNMDPNVHRITDLQADTLLLSNHNNTNSKAGL